VERDELHLQFQPQVTVADGTTKGAEVLLRWHHATEGDVSPSRFVPVLEETGLIRTVDRWLVREACEQAARWHASAGTELTVSVNLSARQLSDPALIEIVSEAIEASKLSPKCLELEITEHTLMEDLDSSVRILRALKAVGVSVAIDDFGTGYASLTYLRQLPIDTIKIDGSFVRGIADDPVNATIVRSTIDLAHGLGLRTVAEGVERQSDLEQLKVFGCDLVQGYLTCRPLRGEQLIDWLGGGKQPAPRRKAG
jgi:EAL domain-containing protein (putative c-di-GMP-specific phosphodiesterase class I)